MKDKLIKYICFACVSTFSFSAFSQEVEMLKNPNFDTADDWTVNSTPQGPVAYLADDKEYAFNNGGTVSGGPDETASGGYIQQTLVNTIPPGAAVDAIANLKYVGQGGKHKIRLNLLDASGLNPNYQGSEGNAEGGNNNTLPSVLKKTINTKVTGFRVTNTQTILGASSDGNVTDVSLKVNLSVFAPSSKTSVSVPSTNIYADNTASSTVTLQLKDPDGKKIERNDANVTFEADKSTASIGTVTKNANGTYTAEVKSSAPGDVVITAKIDGAVVPGSQTIKFIPVLEKPTIKSVAGDTESPFITNVKKPSIIFNASNGSTVTVADYTCSPDPVTNKEVTCTPDNDLLEGENTITPTAKDVTNNTQTGDNVKFTVDLTAPTVPVIISVDGDTTAPFLTKNKKPSAVFSASNDSTVTVAGYTCSPVTNKEVTCTSDVDLADGKNDIPAPKSVDAAGNSVDGDVTKVTVDTKTDEPTIVLEGNSNGKLTVKGKAEANSDVKVTMPSGDIVNVTADQDGNYSATSLKGEDNGDVKVIATDALGNVSTEAKAAYTDTTDPVKPSGIKITPESDGKVTVSGEGEPNSKVEVTLPSGEVVEATVGPDGKFNVKSKDSSKDGPVKIKTTDPSGNSSESTETLEDKTDPVKPSGIKITPESDGKVTVSGEGEPNSKVEVTLPSGEVVEATVGPDGKFNVKSKDSSKDGPVKIKTTDPSGNSSESTETLEDKTDPVKPSGIKITPESDGKVTVSGEGEPNSKVEVTLPSGEVVEATVGPDGKFNVKSKDSSKDGPVKIKTTDPSGNSSESTETLEDKTDPVKPSGIKITPESDGKVTVSGEGEPNSKVEVTLPSGEVIEATVGPDGKFNVKSKDSSKDGPVKIKTTDPSGNSSESTETLEDKTDPVKPSGIKITPESDGKVTVSGEGEPNSKVEVTLPSGEVVEATVGPDGKFNVKSKDSSKDGPVKIKTTDPSGNSSESTETLEDKTDPVKPSGIKITPESDGKVTVSGEGEPNSKVEVTLPSGEVVEATVGPDGKFNVKSKDSSKDGPVKIKTTDPSGNSSESTETLEDKTDPVKPSGIKITPESDGKVTVSGEGEPNSKVEVTLPSGEVVEATVGPDGKFNVKSKDSSKDGPVKIKTTDPSGNSSESTETLEDKTDPVKPSGIKITPESDGKVTVSGEGEPNSKVEVTLPSGEVIEATVGPDGKFNVKSKDSSKDGPVKIKTTDPSGNSSESTETLEDKTDPVKPSGIKITPESDGKVTVSGEGEPNSKVEVTLPSGEVVEATVGPDGKFNVKSKDSSKDGPVKIKTTDPSGNSSESTETLEDKTDPVKPSGIKITPESDGKVTVSGEGEPNSKVEVTLPSGEVVEATVGPDGKFNVKSKDSSKDGPVKIKTTDPSGNSSESTETLEDKTDPVKPSGIKITPESDGKVTVSGEGEPNSKVEVTLPSGEVVEATVGPDGKFNVKSKDSSKDGPVKIKTTDPSGNSSESTETLEDKTDPVKPSGIKITPESDGKVTVSGEGEPNSKVEVTLPSGEVVEATVGPDGKFNVKSKDSSKDGPVKIKTTDPSGNSSESTETLEDKTDPVKPSGIKITPESDGKVTVSGEGEPNSKVEVTLPSGEVVEATVGPDGKFNVKSKDSSKDGPVKIKTTDPSGNSSESTETLEDKTDPVKPSGIKITPESDGKVTVSGEGEPNSKVEVTLPSGEVIEATVGPDGKFNVKSKDSSKDGPVKIKTTDPSGNSSESTETLEDKTDPVKPSGIKITPESDGKVTVSGEGEPNSKVEVTLPSGEVVEATVGPDGKFNVKSKDSSKDGPVKIKTTDPSGNSSESTETLEDKTDPVKPSGIKITPESDGKVTVSGEGEPNSKVEVTLPSGEVVEATVGPDGKFNVKSKDSSKDGPVKIKTTDPSGNSSESTETLEDKTDPVKPTGVKIESTSDGKIKVTGKAEPGSTVSVKLPDGTTETVKADANGDFSFVSTTAQKSGGVSLSVTDINGNKSAAVSENFVNTSGSITIVQVQTGPDRDISYTASDASLSFVMSVSKGDGRREIKNLAPGNYTFTAEDLTSEGYGIENISCNDNDSTTSVDSRSATVVLGNAESVVCTFLTHATRDHTSQSIREFLGARNTLVLSNQADLSRRLNRLNNRLGDNRNVATGALNIEGVTVATGLLADASVTGGQFSFNTSLSQLSESNNAWDVWVEGKFSNLTGENTSANFDIFHAGVDYRVNDDVLVGLSLQYDRFEQDPSGQSTAKIDSRGWMIGPYGLFRLTDNLYLDTRAAWGQSSNDIKPFNTFEDSFDTDRYLISVGVVGEFNYGNWSIRPTLQAQYIEENQDSYVDSVGVTIPDQTVSQGEVRFGPRISYTHQASDGTLIEPWTEIQSVYTFTDEGDFRDGSFAEEREGMSGSVGVGVDFTSPNGLRFSISGEANGLGTDSRDYGVNADLRIPLK